MLNGWFPAFLPVTDISTSDYILKQIYYMPLPASVLNEDSARGVDYIDQLRPWDYEKVRA